MSTTNSLVAEMITLRAAVAAHKALIDDACEARDGAIEFASIPVKFGRYDFDFAKDGWRHPAVAEATRVLEALKDDDGYFWACSRLRDIEGLLGDSLGQRQLPLRTEAMYVPIYGGHIPAAHPSVRNFLAAA